MWISYINIFHTCRARNVQIPEEDLLLIGNLARIEPKFKYNKFLASLGL